MITLELLNKELDQLNLDEVDLRYENILDLKTKIKEFKDKYSNLLSDPVNLINKVTITSDKIFINEDTEETAFPSDSTFRIFLILTLINAIQVKEEGIPQERLNLSQRVIDIENTP